MTMKEKYISRIYRIIFLVLGVKVDSNTFVYEKCYLCVLCGNIVLTCGPQMAAIFAIEGFLHRMEILSFVLITFTVLCQPLWMMFVVRERVVAFYYNLLGNGDIFDERFCDHFERKVKRKIKLISYFNLLAIVVQYSMPVLLWFATEEAVRQQSSARFFLLAAVYPWSTDSAVPFMLTVLLQMLTFHSTLIYLCGFLLIYYVHVLLSLMHSRLTSLIDETLDAVDAIRERTSDESRQMSALQQVIAFHKLTIEIMRDFSLILKPFMCTAVFYFFSAGTIYVMKMFSPAEGNTSMGLLNVKGFVIVVWISFPLIFSVLVGQQYDEINDRISMEIFHTKWFDKTRKYRKVLTIFLTMLRKPETIKLFGFWTINWKYFTSVCRFTYSALQLLRRAEH